jgi:hypothetical protein
MAEPSKRKSSVRRQISLVGCGDSFPQRITLNERICEYIPLDTDHTAILHECIRLAWSMVFSTTGARMTAQSLVESWLPPSLDPALSPTEKDQVFAKAVLEVENFKNSYPVTVFMDSNMRKCSEVDCDEVVKIRLNFYVGPWASLRLIQSYNSTLPRRNRDLWLQMGRLMLNSGDISTYSLSPCSLQTACSTPYTRLLSG